MSAGDICNSTETWYARKINERNNLRILYEVANAFNLDIPVMTDSYSFDQTTIAACTTDTMQSDIFIQKDGMLTILNKCTDTTKCQNGILYNMNPSEGVWLFKGPLKTNSAMMHYGDSFGDQKLQTSFPVSANIINRNYSWKNNLSREQERDVRFVTTWDGCSVARIDSSGNVCSSNEISKYSCVDESFFDAIRLSHWKRENGIVELIPIAVVHQATH
jgi:hypothetical protein